MFVLRNGASLLRHAVHKAVRRELASVQYSLVLYMNAFPVVEYQLTQFAHSTLLN